MPKTAIVTGASSGIGKSIAKKLANEGFNVVLVARNEEKLQVISEDIRTTCNGSALVMKTDISKRDQVQHMYQKAKEQFGNIDVYVNNAGLMLSAAIIDRKMQDWESMIDVNVKGVLYGLHEVIPDMKEMQSGHIINIASVSGFEITKKSTVYSATKFAVRAISTGLEKELAHTGVRVTNISPGMVDTSLTTRSMMNRQPLDEIGRAHV